MRLFVPCTVVNGRRYVMAAPAVEPVLHVFSFRSATQALDARELVTTRPWKLEHLKTVVHDVEPLDDLCGGAAEAAPVVWETNPVELAMQGLAGPSGFGIGMCEFVEPDTIRVLDTATVRFEEFDLDSVRARFELEVRNSS